MRAVDNIGLGESATWVSHRPDGWQEQSYVVIRKLYDGVQRRLTPAYTVILVSRTDLPLAELVHRHRGKQGRENAFKGPLIDMDLHHPPCRRFCANQAFYACGQLAQVLLRAIQYQLLPGTARRQGSATVDSISDAYVRPTGANRPALAAGLCQDQLPPGLVDLCRVSAGIVASAPADTV